MSNTQECTKQLKRYLIARIPLIVVNTIERSRILDILRNIADDMVQDTMIEDSSFFVHTFSRGIYDIRSGEAVDEGAVSFVSALDFLADMMRTQHRDNQTLVLTEVSDIGSDTSDAQRLLDVVSLAVEHGTCLIVLTNKPVWNTLQRHGLIVGLDLPGEEEMYGIIRRFVEDYQQEMPIEWGEDEMRDAAATLTGVTQIEAENVMAALVANGEIRNEDMIEVRSAKNRLFSNISGLEKIDVDPDMKHVGGLQGLRNWLEEKKTLLRPEKREQMRRLHLQPPRGILLVGVPGCGKSMSAKSISANWQLPLYRLDFATVQGSYVGQSEQQLKDALTTAENVSPCILWIDEIEKGLSGAGSSNDGGVSTRMVGQFLFWLQECRKQIFVVATANDVSMLPSELLRRGRFDEIFFVDLPTMEERLEILSLYFSKYLHTDLAAVPTFAERLVQMSEGFTGADLESTVRELAYRMLAAGQEELGDDEIISTFENVVPLSKTSPEKIEAIRDWGRERAVPASGRPIGEETLPKAERNHVRRVLTRH